MLATRGPLNTGQGPARGACLVSGVEEGVGLEDVPVQLSHEAVLAAIVAARVGVLAG